MKKCACKTAEEKLTIQDVIEVLEREVSGYSENYVPERIQRLRNFIKAFSP